MGIARRPAVAALRDHDDRRMSIWYSESAVKPNTLVRFDPKTEKFQTWAIPSGGGVVRNMMPTRDGNHRDGLQRCQSRGARDDQPMSKFWQLHLP